MVIDFSASWCGPCKIMEPALNDMAVSFTDVDFVKLDVDELPVWMWHKDSECMRLKNRVKKTKEHKNFNENGKEVDRVVGAQKNELEKKVGKHRC
ncbi:Thioredoxin H2 [Hibiscus syriacus]|uniref:Thioredoxin H2 n=1 Tax=Hibiscus syriacus TaxID=106335 RepID=A0A6A2XYX7_HIBSY|nr:Thioredoxin H2 [Hibiscus syriacus]